MGLEVVFSLNNCICLFKQPCVNYTSLCPDTIWFFFGEHLSFFGRTIDTHMELSPLKSCFFCLSQTHFLFLLFLLPLCILQRTRTSLKLEGHFSHGLLGFMRSLLLLCSSSLSAGTVPMMLCVAL